MIRQTKCLANLTLPSWREASIDASQEGASPLTVEIPFVDLERSRSDSISQDFRCRGDDVGMMFSVSVVAQADRSAKECAQSVWQPGVDLINTNGGRHRNRAIFPLKAIAVARTLAFVNSSRPMPEQFTRVFRGIQARIAFPKSVLISALRPIAGARTKASGVMGDWLKFATTILTCLYRHIDTVPNNYNRVKLARLVA